MNAYDKRVRELEKEGLTTSDAQSAADVEFSKIKHTPGPWEWTPGDCYDNSSKHHLELVQEGMRGDTDSILYHGADWPVKAADARLIAAAPKLLAALKKVARLPYTLCEPTRRIELSREMEREIRAAIAEAEESP